MSRPNRDDPRDVFGTRGPRAESDGVACAWTQHARRRAAGVVACGLAVAFPVACASAGQRLAVDVPEGRAPTLEERVARDVGRLLSGDGPSSRAAERSLLSLDDAGRAALAAHAARIPTQRDRRWLHVLDANGLLPALSTDEAVEFRLWQASRRDQALLMKADAALADLAARDPGPLEARLLRPRPGRDLLALALGTARARSAVPALVLLYRGASTPEERRAASEALARILGEDARPRADATPAERAAEADRVLALAGASEAGAPTQPATMKDAKEDGKEERHGSR